MRSRLANQVTHWDSADLYYEVDSIQRYFTFLCQQKSIYFYTM